MKIEGESRKWALGGLIQALKLVFGLNCNFQQFPHRRSFIINSGPHTQLVCTRFKMYAQVHCKNNNKSSATVSANSSTVWSNELLEQRMLTFWGCHFSYSHSDAPSSYQQVSETPSQRFSRALPILLQHHTGSRGNLTSSFVWIVF